MIVFIASHTVQAHHLLRRSEATLMMIPIKIQCGCGQRYAFDVETAGELMPNAVVCPVCGADGSIAANVAIAQGLSSQPPVPAARTSGTRIRIATPPPPVAPTTGPRRAAPLPGQIDPAQAQHEAKAKIFWGDPPETVIRYLLMQGFSREEASGLVNELFRERAATVRANGIRKILTGIGLIAVPIVTLIIFMIMRVILVRIFALTVAVGLWGFWTLVNGIIMLLAPKSERGDLADQ